MIISLTGPKKVGKDTVVKIWKIITENPHFTDEAISTFLNRDLYYPGLWEHKKWAGVPNEAFRIITGTDYSNLPREEKEDVRPIFIDFADNHMKQIFGEDIWVKALMKWYKKEKPPKWIISDTRLKIEFDVVKENKGVTIFLNRHDIEIDYSHRTETELLDEEFDYYLTLIPGDLKHTVGQVRDLISVIEIDRNIKILKEKDSGKSL